MQVTSISFLFLFLPCFLACYYFTPRKARKAVLVLGSLLFYYLACSNLKAGTFFDGSGIWQLALLMVLTLLTYTFGLTLGQPGRGKLLAGYLVVLAGILVFFKCYAGGKYLPGGMSFYLFQMTAYLIDVYRRRLTPERSLVSYSSQILMFPKLLSGPIVNPKDLKDQVHSPNFNLKFIHRGIQEIVLGLFLKVMIANRLGGLWGQAAVIGYESISTPFAWLALIAYAMRLYFDFYGYSLMAVGLGRMLGYELPMNFLDPYCSKSVSEFYRRWHVTLGAWFRDYIYIPLGGNRHGTFITMINLTVVWLFTGLWHGVGGNYLLWAFFLLFFIILERLWLRKHLEKSKIWSHVYLVFVILLSWLPFAIGDFEQLKIYLLKLFNLGGTAVHTTDYITWGKQYFWLLLTGVLFATPIPGKLWENIRKRPFADLLIFILFWVIVCFISTSAQDPFMYFQY